MVPETYQNPKRANEAARKQTKEGKALKGRIAQTSSLPTLHWGSPGQGTATRPCTPDSHRQIPAGPPTSLPHHQQIIVGSDNIWVQSNPTLS